MNDRIGEGVVPAHTKRQGADSGAGFVLLIGVEERPAEGNGTLSVVRNSFVAKWTYAWRELQDHVELRQQHDNHFGALFLLFGFEHGFASLIADHAVVCGISIAACFPTSLASATRSRTASFRRRVRRTSADRLQ